MTAVRTIVSLAAPSAEKESEEYLDAKDAQVGGHARVALHVSDDGRAEHDGRAISDTHAVRDDRARADPHVVADRHAPSDDRPRNDQATLPDLGGVRDVNDVVDLRVVADPRRTAEQGAIDHRICLDLDAPPDDDGAGVDDRPDAGVVRDTLGAGPVLPQRPCFELEALGAKDRARADDRALADGHTLEDGDM